ncbi:MAG: HAMP domain-containing sensor histidine kinase [Eubacteriales bacterium]|nr:HAMP domain-containing sensor histidine kinase [Eubacteriales bacterium]
MPKMVHNFLSAMILTFLASLLLFVLLQALSDHILHDYCRRPSVVEKNAEETRKDLQKYIDDRRLKREQASALEAWVEERELTDLIVYNGEQVLYRSNVLLSPYTKKQNMELYFADGAVNVEFRDLFEHRYKDWITYINLFIFFMVFVLSMSYLVLKKVRYIYKLKDEIEILEGGALDYPFSIEGSDELTELAEEIDEMRKAFLEREQYTEQLQKANKELMAGISHDLRSPLCTLSGYLDLLSDSQLSQTDRGYLRKCKRRAKQLQDLIDHLFEYFFAYTSEKETLHVKTMNIEHALSILTGEMVQILKQDGYEVKEKIIWPMNDINADRNLLQRLFDNVTSNILRYGDQNEPVRIIGHEMEGRFELIISNRILADEAEGKAGGTGIGLRVCRRIMCLHDGDLEAETKNEHFIVRLLFPVHSTKDQLRKTNAK